MKKFLILFSLIFCWEIAAAQLPNTNIYLFDLNKVSDSLIQFQNPKLLTGFNSKGYNNQPSFVSKDEIYFSMGEASGATPTNVVSLNLRTYVKTQVTLSQDREYSPTPLLEPFYFSCVRQEADGKETQRLWVFPMDRSSNGQAILPITTGVGYHCWLKNDLVALFIVGDPHKLAIGNTKNNLVKTITSNIGRCLKRNNAGNLIYVHKATDTNWTIKEYDVRSERSSNITSTIPQGEDFVILKDGTILMAKGSKIFKYKKGIDSAWLQVADFSRLGLRNITRMAVNNNGKIALVNVE